MKIVLLSTIFSIALIVLAISASNNTNQVPSEKQNDVNNVTVVDGVQYVDLETKGGYEPRKSFAKAGIPTIIRFNTSNTYDCSTIVRIPNLKLQKTLPPTGKTEVDIGVQSESTFRGSCGMGMYPFEIQFK